MQNEMSKANKAAWESKAYLAWVREHGEPAVLAEELKRNHRHLLRYWLKYIGDPSGKRVLNLLGSNGRKSISLALMGADVTVVDISEENRRYAIQVAEAAGVELDYICADALRIPNENELGEYDFVLMEFGILHYFSDLKDIMSVVHRRLKAGGRYLLTDFHPFARAWKNSGEYFESHLREGDVAFTMLLPEEERAGLAKTLTRSWTVGDILTVVGGAGLFIRTFEELRNAGESPLPDFYTLVADKIEKPLLPLYPLA